MTMDDDTPESAKHDFEAALARRADEVERMLDALLGSGLLAGEIARPDELMRAIRHGVLGGGKRLRPFLVIETAALFDADGEAALRVAAALECIHCYSLIHDDLPCMDNDDLRRGRPTAHRQFDEATALLAGDALLTHAFALLAEAYVDRPVLAHALIRELADAAGSRRLIGGQMEDLLAEKKANATAAELEFIHLNKTAAMIEAALVLGGLIGGANEDGIASLRLAGRHLGLAFQIVDDLLDATADTATLGKTAGKDAKAGKTTFVKVHGLDKSRQFAAHHTAAALAALKALPGDTRFLVALFEAMLARGK